LGNPKIEEWIYFMGMTSDWIEVFYTPPLSSGVIHTDNGSGDYWTKIIYQFGAKNSTMRWWESTKPFRLVPGVEKYLDENIKDFKNVTEPNSPSDDLECHYSQQVFLSLEKDAKIIHEVEIGEASLVNTGILHSSYNPTTEKRFVVTIGLFDRYGERLLWDDVLTKMKRYLK
jgi:hypothetical protein